MKNKVEKEKREENEKEEKEYYKEVSSNLLDSSYCIYFYFVLSLQVIS